MEQQLSLQSSAQQRQIQQSLYYIAHGADGVAYAVYPQLSGAVEGSGQPHMARYIPHQPMPMVTNVATSSMAISVSANPAAEPSSAYDCRVSTVQGNLVSGEACDGFDNTNSLNVVRQYHHDCREHPPQQQLMPEVRSDYVMHTSNMHNSSNVITDSIYTSCEMLTQHHHHQQQQYFSAQSQQPHEQQQPQPQVQHHQIARYFSEQHQHQRKPSHQYQQPFLMHVAHNNNKNKFHTGANELAPSALRTTDNVCYHNSNEDVYNNDSCASQCNENIDLGNDGRTIDKIVSSVSQTANSGTSDFHSGAAKSMVASSSTIPAAVATTQPATIASSVHTPFALHDLAQLVTFALEGRCSEHRHGNRHGQSVFHSTRVPSITIQDYIRRIAKYSGCSPECFVLAVVLIDRYCTVTNFPVTLRNIHRLYITTIMISAKLRDDIFYSNSYYANIGGVTNRELNFLEVELLTAIQWTTWVEPSLFTQYVMRLRSCYARNSITPGEKG